MSILHKLTLLFLLAMSTLNEGSAFVHPLLPTQQYVTKITEVATVLQMGWLDNLFNSKTFPPDAQVTARHILLKKREEAEEIKKKVQRGNFAKLAREFSVCPSAARGGELGTFSPGQMAPDFDEAVFDPEVSKVGQVTDPIMTPFGYHLIIVDKRSGV